MTDFRRICCPTDFSESSRGALEEAAQIARRYGASLTLLHVVEPAATAAEVAFAPPPGWAEDASAATLASWKADAERMRGGQVATSIVSGGAAVAIVDFVRSIGADLIVMGSHGRKGFRRLVLGSVAEQVVRTAPCEVLVVRHEPPARPAPSPDAPLGMPA